MIALKELVSCDLVVVAAQVVIVFGSRAMVLGYHGRRVRAVLQAGGSQRRATCNARLFALRLHGLRALGLFDA
jgi:hypothetical protein